MLPPRFLVGLTLLLGVPAAVQAGDEAGTGRQPTAHFLTLVWSITDTILDQHVEPPTRQQMYLAGARGLLRAAGTEVAAGLGARASGLATREQFDAFLKDAWPRTGQVPPKEQLESTLLRGLLQSVPGRPYLIGGEQLRVQEQLDGNSYVGTGIQIRLNPEEKLAEIVRAFRDSPARRAGAKPGDLIVAVDGQPVPAGDGVLSKTVKMLRGNEGTTVSFDVRQVGTKETRTLRMVRSTVPFDTLGGYRRAGEDRWDYHIESDSPVAYVHVDSINSSTLHELRDLERRLTADGFRALVLDLRGSMGEGVHHAALLADGLLDGGLLWRVRDSRNHVQEYRADRDCLFRGWPLAVLIDSHTAGTGAAALAAALQDNHRAILVGEPVTAEPFVTSFVALPGGVGSVSLRTGIVERATPRPAADGDDAAVAWPIQPDHSVRLEPKQIQAVQEWHARQVRLQGPSDPKDKAPADAQLAKALALLRTQLR